MKVQDTYKEPVIMEMPGAIVRVYRPELSQEEYARRMKIIHNAAADLLMAKAVM